ncbi:MAG: hypothetical protein ACYTG5_01285 [Planctomycetota bacterium]|jgi:hypothetical protein
MLGKAQIDWIASGLIEPDEGLDLDCELLRRTQSGRGALPKSAIQKAEFLAQIPAEDFRQPR